MKDGRMIAWFQSVRQEECGCCSKVITVYFGHTHTHSTYSPSLRLAVSALFDREQRLTELFLTLSGGSFNSSLTRESEETAAEQQPV